MTPYIEDKKAEATVQFVEFFEKWNESRADVFYPEKFFGPFLDTLLDEIESRVVPTEMLMAYMPGSPYTLKWKEGYNKSRAKVLEAFQHLRTGVENEV